MGKQYISTVTASNAHKLDILAVAITKQYTITVSSDGFAAFWNNQVNETHVPEEHVVRHLISPLGIHHISIFEDVPPGLETRVLIMAFACFDGSVKFYSIFNLDISTFQPVETGNTFQTDCWCPGFYTDPTSTQHLFVVTKASGKTSVYNLDLAVESNSVDIAVTTHVGDLNASNVFSSFPGALAISSEGMCAIGYTMGDVVVYNLKGLKQVFTFHSTDYQVKEGIGSTSVPRVIRFSPGGSILVVARDNQSAGSITLYDIKYGENIGTLTTLTHSAKTTIGGFAHESWIMDLSFNSDGSLLASAGFDKCVRVWSLELREREATLQISGSDLESVDGQDASDISVCSGVAFIDKGVRGGLGGDINEGLCVVSFDRGIRWFREAGGV